MLPSIIFELTDLHFGVDFSVVFEGVEGLQDGVVVVGTCKPNNPCHDMKFLGCIRAKNTAASNGRDRLFADNSCSPLTHQVSTN